MALQTETIEKIHTVSGFLRASGMTYRVFSLGRRVTSLIPEVFAAFEEGEQPYPEPFQRRALLGLIFWDPEQPMNRHVWFLKFPLDEAGLLVKSSQAQFLERLVKSVGGPMKGLDGRRIEAAAAGSPYLFTPREDKKVAFYALANKNLGLPASESYEAALAYFTGDQNMAEWQGLKLQGVADVAVRLSTTDKSLDLRKTLPQIPEKPFSLLCAFWEHASPDVAIVEALAHRAKVEAQEKKPDIARIVGCLRASSNSPAQGLLKEMVDSVLAHPCGQDVKVLAIISGRCWTVLQYPDTCLQFVEQLAKNTEGQSVFSYLLSDVMFLPGMREPLMEALQAPNRSNELIRAADIMLGAQTV